jgi:hypothetical protein
MPAFVNLTIARTAPLRPGETVRATATAQVSAYAPDEDIALIADVIERALRAGGSITLPPEANAYLSELEEQDEES